MLDLDSDGAETLNTDAGIYFDHNNNDSKARNGFEALADLNSNNDGVINQQDAQYLAIRQL